MRKLSAIFFLVLFLSVPALGQGYLAPEELPDSLFILPPPPAVDSLQFQVDIDQFRQTRSVKGTPRWKQAAFDADLDNNWNKFYTSVLGLEITLKGTPATYELLKKAGYDSNEAAGKAKRHYNRVRPFIYFKLPAGSTCFPKQEAFLATNGSFPSGHTTIGWTQALILAELFPEKQDAILARGLDYGYSRVICGVHWYSDVQAGLITGTVSVARLHANPEFQAALAAAKEELAKVKAKARRK
jgi:acid phosphatase (class A)